MTRTPILRICAEGREFERSTPTAVALGRDEANDICLDDGQVSRRHAVVEFGPDGWVFRDLDSRNGSFRDGTRISALTLSTGSVRLRLGDQEAGADIELVVSAPPSPVQEEEQPRATRLGKLTAVHDAGRRTVIGRGADCDLVLDDLTVSRRHAELLRTESGLEIVDLQSFNGTFVNGNRVVRSPVADGDLISVGGHLLRVFDGRLEQYADRGEAWLLAAGLTTLVDRQRVILNDVSFALEPASLLAVVGPSGSGKTTLLGALTGMYPASSGEVVYGGRNLYAAYDELQTRIGFVPQDDILHRQLTVGKALSYAAELRFPPEVAGDERQSRVDQVMAELGLSERADLVIDKLSGGQRKRVSVALELLTKPSLLFLDEPTSGLDPGNEEQVMGLLRDLADGGRTVIAVIHSVQSLDLCDRILFLARGGNTAYYGPSGEALEFFHERCGARRYAEVFQALDERSDFGWTQSFRDSAAYDSYVARPLAQAEMTAAAAPRQRRPAARRGRRPRQLSVLVRRYITVLLSDRRNLALLALQAPLFGLLYSLLIGPDTLSTSSGAKATMLIWLLVIGATWLGTSNAIREIVKERPIFEREHAVGLSPFAYVISKVVVLAPITIMQAAVLVMVALANQSLPPSDPYGFLSVSASGSWIGSPAVELIVGVALAGLAAMALGLFVSSIVRSSDRALVLLPVILIGQVVLSVPFFHASSAALESAGVVSSAQWGTAAAASTVSLNDLRAVDQAAAIAGQSAILRSAQPQPHAPVLVRAQSADGDARWAHSASVWRRDATAVLLLLAVPIAAAVLALGRGTRRRRGA